MDRSGHLRAPFENGQLYEGEAIRTREGTTAVILFSTGTQATLMPNSIVYFDDLQQQEDGGTSDIHLQLYAGRVVSNVKKLQPGSSYEVHTLVGSTSVKGTHFEIELINGDTFLAVWDGAIDLNVNSGSDADSVSLGEGEDFSYASINEEGAVTRLLEAPENFDEGSDSSTEEDEDMAMNVSTTEGAVEVSTETDMQEGDDSEPQRMLVTPGNTAEVRTVPEGENSDDTREPGASERTITSGVLPENDREDIESTVQNTSGLIEATFPEGQDAFSDAAPLEQQGETDSETREGTSNEPGTPLSQSEDPIVEDPDLSATEVDFVM
ncbi:MAG: hypothetical protein E1N59_317 [Puniceicoccaceae bacterium 5H]|nr:MAG: hypothetical protein E1N59_317 [Puniceicoccaceae bacterium 5H]